MSLTNIFSFPYKGMEYNSLPNYSITNVPILTYALIGITTLTLGYITMKDKEAENASSSSSSDTVNESSESSEIKEEKGGRRLNKKINKTKKTNLKKSNKK